MVSDILCNNGAMRKIYVVIIILIFLILSELYVLNQTNSLSMIVDKKIQLYVTPTLSPQELKKEVQNRLINDVDTYIKSSGENKKMMLMTLSYRGLIQSISQSNGKITIVTENEKKERIEKYFEWDPRSFTVYRNEKESLIKSDLSDIKVGSKVVVREFEEVTKNTSDPTNIVSYVEFVIE